MTRRFIKSVIILLGIGSYQTHVAVVALIDTAVNNARAKEAYHALRLVFVLGDETTSKTNYPVVYQGK